MENDIVRYILAQYNKQVINKNHIIRITLKITNKSVKYYK